MMMMGEYEERSVDYVTTEAFAGPSSESPLHQAVLNGDTDQVCLLVLGGHDINSWDINGFTPLHYAVMKDHCQIITILGSLGADVNLGTIFKSKTPLHIAARLGKITSLRLLATFGVNMFAMDDTGSIKMPLHTAVKYNHLNVISYLLQIGVPVDVMDGRGVTALLYAVKSSDPKIVQFLIDNEADVNVKNPTFGNTTPLHISIEEGRLDITELLLSSGAKVNEVCSVFLRSPIHWAAKKGDIHSLELMCRCATVSLGVRDGYGNQPIHIAVSNEHLLMVNLLINKGVSVNSVNAFGRMPLHLAAKVGHPDIVLSLLQHGAQVNTRTNDDECRTPLDIASYCGRTKIIRALVQYGADVNAIDMLRPYSAMHYAVMKNNFESLVELHRCGGNVQINMGTEYEPLIITATKFKSEVAVKWLLNKGISADCKDYYEKAPLHYASHAGFLYLANLLLKRGANVNIIDGIRVNPLHFATVRGNLDIVQLLVSMNADMMALNGQGLSPLHTAAYIKEPFCLQFMVKKGCSIMAPTNNESADLPIHIAVRNSSVITVQWILNNGVPIDIMNGGAIDPLTAATFEGRYDMCKYLLMRGANVNVRTGLDNSTPLHIASYDGRLSLVQLLIEHGADVHALTLGDECTPLHMAVFSKNKDVVETLVHCGADAEARNIDDITPLEIAIADNLTDIADFLRAVILNNIGSLSYICNFRFVSYGIASDMSFL